MADSSRTALIEKWRRWKQRNRSFPLSVHPNGQWCKKVLGRIRFFGVLENPKEALKNWNKDRPYLLAGEEPPVETDGKTLANLCDEHMADCLDRVEVGKMARWSVKDYRLARRMIDAAGVADVRLKAIGAHHFTEIQKAIDRSGLRLRTQRNAVMSVMGIINWGVGNERCSMPSLGTRFKAPSSSEIETEQDDCGSVRFFDRELLLPAIHYADERMLVVILLGLNCAFYPGDTEAITLDHLHLDHPVPYHDFRRVKTGRRRMAALWPETVAAIRQYLTVRRPERPDEPRLLVNQWGRPYSKASAGKSISRLFDDLIATVGSKPSGASLGSLRHTSATAMDLARDQQMIDLVMGHVSGTQDNSRKKNLQKRIYSQLNLGELDRLAAVAEVVRQWFYYGKIFGVPGPDHVDHTGAATVRFKVVG